MDLRTRFFPTLILSPLLSFGQNTITVNPAVILTDVSQRPVGININYLRDDNNNRPSVRPLQDALREMGAGMVRYPGGEKSDWQLWSVAPWTQPIPQVNPGYVSGQGTDLLNFDEYMAYIRSVGAEPYVVVGYDNVSRTGWSKAQYLENATQWVRYANIVKGYGVKYWEIGNENWNNSTGTAAELGNIVVEFSRAMKAVDPTIKIGASGNNSGWWGTLLPIAARDMDFLTVSNYSCYGWDNMDVYRNDPQINLIGTATNAISSINAYAPIADRARLNVIVSECNCAYANLWPNRNDLGHALVVADMFGQFLVQAKIGYSMLWNTRWLSANSPSGTFYALGGANELLPSGRAVAVWGTLLREKMISVTRTNTVITYASYSAGTGDLSVFLINKSTASQPTTLSIGGSSQYASIQTYRYSGTSDADLNPVWSAIGPIVLTNNLTTVNLPATTLTVFTFRNTSIVQVRVNEKPILSGSPNTDFRTVTGRKVLELKPFPVFRQGRIQLAK